MKKTWIFVPVLLTGGLLLAQAQENDNRNVMLNAESATIPREINVGLPGSSNGTVVNVDGMKHALGIVRAHYHWSGGNAYEPVATNDIVESAIYGGVFGITIDSRTRLGGDKLYGAFTYGTSSNGLFRFDGAVNGPLNGKGWYFSLGAYANLDPTSVNSPSRTFVEQKQIYQAALTKRWSGASLSLLYRLSFCGDRIDNGYSVAPFVYNGDGSISLYNGFKLGRDCYVPADESVRWMDVRTGEWKTGDMARMDRRTLHDASILYRQKDFFGWELEAGYHLCYMAPAQFLKVTLAGIDNVDASKGFTTAGGNAYTGQVQNRLVKVYDTWIADSELQFIAKRQLNRYHHLGVGVLLYHNRQYEAGSTFNFAHSVGASPERLAKNGEATWSYNRSASYLDSWRVLAALYAFHTWRPSAPLMIRTGLRIKPEYMDINTAARLNGEDKNRRVEGFNLADASLSTIHNIRTGNCESYVVSEQVSWRASRAVTLMADACLGMTGKAPTYYRNSTLPSLKPVGQAYGVAGANFTFDWLDLSAVVSYITTWDNASSISVTKQIAGTSETIPWVAEYGIGTPGFTLDGSVHTGGFNLHVRATLQDPRYRNYSNEFVFSDGSVQNIDYTGNTVTGISRVMVELDPSYRWKGWRFRGNLRYFSRQYVSRTNYAYFNGHFETFAGVDWKISGHHSLSLSLINVLMQSGAKGSIDIADTIGDPSELNGLIMAGTYIRPFTIDLSYTYKF